MQHKDDSPVLIVLVLSAGMFFLIVLSIFWGIWENGMPVKHLDEVEQVD